MVLRHAFPCHTCLGNCLQYEHPSCHVAGYTNGPPESYQVQGDPVPKMFNAFNGLGIMVVPLYSACLAAASSCIQLLMVHAVAIGHSSLLRANHAVLTETVL